MTAKKPPPQSYASNPLWSNITPIPLRTPENPDHDLASISYSPHYLEATSYLRAVMAANEVSERAMQLTADVISVNPAHYTVWLYRAKVVVELGKEQDDLEERLQAEIEWVNGVAKKNLKNYQIWHHRQIITSALYAPSTPPPASEFAFITSILTLDAKNYHVFAYRQWLIRHYALWESESELAAIDALLTSDVRNNSAWHHRYYLLFGQDEHAAASEQEVADRRTVIDEDLVDREIEFAKGKIWEAPQNGSPWAYLGGVLRRGERAYEEERGFAEQFVDLEGDRGVRSSFALEFLAECARERGDVEAGKVVLGLLGERFDPIRKGYWRWRLRELEGDAKGAVEAKKGVEAVAA